ncbi:MAG: glycosyltransferase [Candidatus Andersenbacteria bacterium]|nr:glycosyltransferase [Candidatus Andersenbacteria bacterium]MBI3250330.1 glycosyltransferase [Candidatus Andersenbacteria bacterium]
MSLGDLKVALVHDELVRRGGAERVLEELIRVFPRAHIYALYASNTPFITVDGKRYRIRTTFLQKFPVWFRQHPRRLALLLLHAAERLDLSKYDLVISSSSAFAKGIVTRSYVPHISYCHTPTRYIWERHSGGIFEKVAQHFLKMADFAAGQRPDIFVANSKYTQARLRKYYRRESTVIYPPVATDFYSPAYTSQKKEYFLCVGRLTPAKQFDQAIAICEKLRLPLHIAGVGQDYARLKNLAGPATTFLGKISDEELRLQYRGAWALLQPGIEDFGMATVESLACGTPVITPAAGGAPEIIEDGKHGILYREPVMELLAEAINKFLQKRESFNPSVLQEQALKFSRSYFRSSLRNVVEEVLRKQHTGSTL